MTDDKPFITIAFAAPPSRPAGTVGRVEAWPMPGDRFAYIGVYFLPQPLELLNEFAVLAQAEAATHAAGNHAGWTQAPPGVISSDTPVMVAPIANTTELLDAFDTVPDAWVNECGPPVD